VPATSASGVPTSAPFRPAVAVESGRNLSGATAIGSARARMKGSAFGRGYSPPGTASTRRGRGIVERRKPFLTQRLGQVIATRLLNPDRDAPNAGQHQQADAEGIGVDGPAQLRERGVQILWPESRVAKVDNGGWSLYGAQRSQRVATGGKWPTRENGADRRKPLPWVATSCLSRSMVRRGSTVRVRQRALEKRANRRLFFPLHLRTCQRASGMEPFMEPPGSERRRLKS
jgi:hypothetical protein